MSHIFRFLIVFLVWVISCYQVLIYKTLFQYANKLHLHTCFGFSKTMYPDLTLTLTIRLPEKYTSGNLRYFQYCCTTHPIPLYVSPARLLREKKKNDFKIGTTRAPTNHRSSTTESISECLNSQKKLLILCKDKHKIRL